MKYVGSLLLICTLLSAAHAQVWTKQNRPPAAALYYSVTAAAGCKVVNVMLPSPDQTTWTAIYDPSCTSAQIAAGNAAIAAFRP